MSANRQTTYIVAVPDNDQPRKVPREKLLEELAHGTITTAYWVWSPEHEDWKQISEIPDLNAPAKKTLGLFAPAPVPPINLPNLKASKAAAKKKVVRRSRYVENHEEGFPYTKVLFAFLYLALCGIVALNYVLIDKPLNAALARTPFVLVPAHGHLGSFVQPDALIIHVLPTHELNQENFADFLYTLAKGTPVLQKPFAMVALTPTWLSQYAFRGDDWRFLAAMTDAKPEDRRNFITDHLNNILGRALIPHPETLSPTDLKSARAQVWQELTSKFLN